MGRTSSAVKNRYNAKTYDTFRVFFKKGEKDKLRARAEARGESLNGFINRAIREAVERDNARTED